MPLPKIALFGITKQYWVLVVPLMGYHVGKWLDDKETERMTNFRDRSALYGGMVKPGDPPSWP